MLEPTCLPTLFLTVIVYLTDQLQELLVARVSTGVPPLCISTNNISRFKRYFIFWVVVVVVGRAFP